MQNSYLSMEMDLANPQIDVLSGNFEGNPELHFKQQQNVLANGQDPLSLNRKVLPIIVNLSKGSRVRKR